MIRWLFSTVSISMAWDDHDMSDDWNISALLARGDGAQGVVARARRRRHHQLLDLPAPRQPLAARARRERALPRGCAATSTRPTELREWAERDRHRPAPAPAGASAATSAARGRSSSTRAPAGCSTEGERSMFDDEDWDWIVEHASGDFDHLLIATTVPFLLSPGFHHLEAWNERRLRRRLGRAGGARRARSCGAPSTSTTGPPSSSPSSGCASCSKRSAPASAARPPASIVVLSGDVHHAYLGEVGFRPEAGVRERRLPGGLLALPQPARRARAAGDPGRLLAPLHRRRRARLARRGRGARPGHPLAPAPRAPTSTTRSATLRLDGREAIDPARQDVAGEEDRRRRLRAAT